MPSTLDSAVAGASTTAASPTEPQRWHVDAVESVLLELETNEDGLTRPEADARLRRYGPNELVDRGSKSPLAIVREQLAAVMVLILIGAAGLSFALGKILEGGAILAIVVLFAALGFLQEYRAERAIAALRGMSAPAVRVLRDGVLAELSARELVPGDVVAIEAGNVVPADLRLIDSANLRVQEAALTGESEAVEKSTRPVEDLHAALGDRCNLAFAGTQVANGRGVGVVVATGMHTELGRIADLLQSVTSTSTPLQTRLDRVGKQLALGGVVVALAVVAIGAAAGETLTDLVVTAVSVAVAVIPEGLPAVVTFTLAIGAQRMLKRNALIRTLPAVETLGSVTMICTDKTGTLTQNRMSAVALDTLDDKLDLTGTLPLGSLSQSASLAMLGGALCSDAELRFESEGEDVSIGDPTELALVRAAHNVGVDVSAVRTALARVAEVSFDSDRKRMTTVHEVGAGTGDDLSSLLGASGGGYIAFVKGAPDRVIELASSAHAEGGVIGLADASRARLIEANRAAAASGMRVLAVAARGFRSRSEVEAAIADESIESDLTMLGLFSIVDPPRPEVRDAVRIAVDAGIRPIMITGDHPLTASAIAQDLGISADDTVVTGREIDELDEAELAARVQTTSVFARVSPEHKLRVVDALRDRGEVVAMTGDGVNDAPALKRADIGVAMGITGTDVSKEASDMVLRDDNFATIVAAVEEGRVIYDNLRRFVKFAVAGNIGKIVVMLAWPIPFLFAGGEIDTPVALLPLQLLWLNLMTDGLLGLSMGIEPAERGVMRRPPHAPGSSIWAGGLGRQVVLSGAAIGAIALGVGFAYDAAGDHRAQTMIFTSLAILQVFQALGTRSSTHRMRAIGWRTNPTMLAIAGFVLLLTFVALYTPMRDVLDLTTLRLGDIALVFGLGIALFVGLELPKRPGDTRGISRDIRPAR